MLELSLFNVFNEVTWVVLKFPAEPKKEVPNALAGLRRGRRGGPPSRMTAKGREEMSNQQARKVDPNKGAAGDQMDFANMYKAADSRRKVAAVRSRGRLWLRINSLREYKNTIKEYVRHRFDNLSTEIIVEEVNQKNSTETIMEKIKRHGDSYVVTDNSGKKVLGKHKTKRAAIKQIAAVEASKAASMDEGLRDIGKGLMQGGALGAVTLGLALGGQNKESSVAPPPDTGVIGQLEDKPSTRPNVIKTKK